MFILSSIIAASPTRCFFKLLALLALVSASSIGRISAAERAATPPCDAFSGTFEFTDFHFTGDTTAEGTGLIWDGDVLIGTFVAEYFNIQQKGNGVIQMNGRHTLSFAGGTLKTFDEIRLQFDQVNPAIGRANSRLYLVGGTVDYQGATGVLHTHGSVDFSTLEGGIDFKGQVCVE